MLGLHQAHKSYSPASAAAVDRASSSKTPGKLSGGGSGATSGGACNNSNRRSQLVMAELLAHQEETSIQTVRMHRIREDLHRRHIVQVPPRTAEPLVIGSMPNCSGKSGGGGGRAATRAARSKHRQEEEEAEDYGVREHHYHQQETMRVQQDEESRHFLLRQQRRQIEADNQVVLIMSDTSGAGANGIPIIGRRLPSKSHPAPQPPTTTHQLEYTEVPEMSVQALHHAPGARQHRPVVGRRSHRAAQRQQDQADHLYHQQESMRRQSVRQHTTQCHQPLSIIETQSAMSERVIRAAQVHHLDYSGHDRAKRYPSVSVLDNHRHNYDEDGHEIFDQQPARSTRRLAPTAPATTTTIGKRASSKSGGAKRSSGPPMFSSSCLSLCNQGEQPAVLCSDPCCLRAAAPAPVLPMEQQGCMMPCCNLLAPADSIPLLKQATSQQHMKRAARRRESASDDMAAYVKPHAASGGPCQANSNQLQSAAYSAYPPFSVGAGASRTRRSSSLSRGDHLAPAAARDRRSSRLLMEPVSGGQQRHLAYNQQIGRHQPSTPPPVPSKPNSHQHHLLMLHHHHHHNHHQHQVVHQQQADDDSAAVTQMYESLAAELKAKLGNPNRAPILLPPKDYDTLSRQQGKLTGIELRRSTNPQLVGPHTSCRGSGEIDIDRNQTNIKEQAAGTEDEAHARTLSKQPLAAEPTSVEPACLQRSRSNSSSGLGSISLGASSPDEHAESRQCSPSGGADVAFASPSRSSCSGASNSPSGSSGLNSSGGQSAESSAHYYEQIQRPGKQAREEEKKLQTKCADQLPLDTRRGKGIENHNPSKVSDGILWNGRIEIPLKVNSERRNGNTYLATKQIIY